MLEDPPLMVTTPGPSNRPAASGFLNSFGIRDLSPVLALFSWITNVRLLRSPAAVDENVRAGDETGVFGAEIECELADFLGLAPAAQGNFGKKLLGEFGVLQQGSIQLRGERPRADTVDRNLFRGQFERQRARETEQRRFAGRIGRAAGYRDVAHDGS